MCAQCVINGLTTKLPEHVDNILGRMSSGLMSCCWYLPPFFISCSLVCEFVLYVTVDHLTLCIRSCRVSFLPVRNCWSTGLFRNFCHVNLDTRLFKRSQIILQDLSSGTLLQQSKQMYKQTETSTAAALPKFGAAVEYEREV